MFDDSEVLKISKHLEVRIIHISSCASMSYFFLRFCVWILIAVAKGRMMTVVRVSWVQPTDFK
jgi:hypothetical protein